METAFITGASRGIGKATALEFARHGIHLALCCRDNMDALIDVMHDCRKYDVQCLIYRCDVSDDAQVAETVSHILDEFGEIDYLINNAGISYTGLLTDMSKRDWNEVIGTNLSSLFYTCKHTIPSMVKKQSGRIVNISSIWGNQGASCEVAYSASKGGVNSFTKALAKELGPSGISVNALSCGYIDTDMNEHLSDDEKQALFEEIPAGRAGTPEEVAQAILSLCCQSPYLTGQIITLDGGWFC